MNSSAIKPAPTDFAPYYGKYVSLVRDGDIIKTLEDQATESLQLLRSLPADKGNFRYGPDKWSVKELIGHLIDSERIFSYRALRFSRNDQIPLAGFEQDGYVEAAKFDRLPLDQYAWERRGIASENEVTVRALAHIIAGHELHHIGILRERYLVG
jgi:hypothetical protein